MHAKALEGARILVVDDTAMVRRALRSVLTAVGAEVIEASHGQEALDLADPALGLVLRGSDMPGLSGIEVCRALRAAPATCRVPICIVTGLADDQHHALALAAGAQDFVSKPPEVRILRARAANLVARYRAERENRRLVAQLEAYVSSATARQAQSHQAAELVEATLLFSDLRGFTSTTKKQDLPELHRALNTVLAHQADLVRQQGGYVDKFAGDGMLAVFEGDDAPLQACAVGSAIVGWARGWQGSIWDPAPIAIGIHAGTVVRGDLGSAERREFTVIGHPVNVAARLCGVAGPLEVVVSDEVAQEVGLAAFSEAQQVLVKGLEAPLVVRRLLTGP